MENMHKQKKVRNNSSMAFFMLLAIHYILFQRHNKDINEQAAVVRREGKNSLRK